MNRIPVALAATAALVLAACGSDSSGDSFGSGQPAATDSTAPTTSRAEVEPTTATSEPSAPPSPAPAASTTTAATGPLPAPTVELFEIGSFDQPVDVASRPGFGDVYVVEQPGRVVAVSDLSTDIVLDITGLTDANGEQGLLGLAFHPTADLA